jgi:hypothetical protein
VKMIGDKAKTDSEKEKDKIKGAKSPDGAIR